MFLADEAALVEIHPSYRRMQHFRNIARLAGKMYMPFNKASVKCKGTSDGLIVDVEALRSFLDPLIAIIRSFRSPLDFCGLEKHCMDKLKKVPDASNPCTDRGGNKHIEVKKTTVGEWGCVPEYKSALEKQLGEGALEKFDTDSQIHMPSMNNYSRILYENFKKLIK